MKGTKAHDILREARRSANTGLRPRFAHTPNDVASDLYARGIADEGQAARIASWEGDDFDLGYLANVLAHGAR